MFSVFRPPSSVLGHLFVSKAIDHVVVDHSGGLHKGIANGRADETKAALVQILAHRVRLYAFWRNLSESLEFVLLCFPSYELPDVFVERAKLFLDLEELPRVLNGRRNLGAIADDARVAQEALDVAPRVAGDFAGVEVVKGAAEVGALVQYNLPIQASLERVEDHELEEFAVVVDGHAPFGVVIFDHAWLDRPGAAFDDCHLFTAKTQRTQRNFIATER